MTRCSRYKWCLAFLLVLGSVCSLAQPLPGETERRLAACITCHGRDGRAANTDYYPRLAGKPASYLFEQLRSFRDGRRHQAEMEYLLANLSDAYLREMAGYFSALDLPYPPPKPSSLSAAELARGRALVFDGDASRGIVACANCHGKSLTGAQPGTPSLLGLPRLYIASQLGAWVTGDRRAPEPDCMADVGRRLNGEDIRALAGWLSAQPVPARPTPQLSVAASPSHDCSATEARR